MPKQNLKVKIDQDLIRCVQDVIMARRGSPLEITMSGWIEDAMADKYQKELLRERRSRGDRSWRFPRRRYQPRIGRPISWATRATETRGRRS